MAAAAVPAQCPATETGCLAPLPQGQRGSPGLHLAEGCDPGTAPAGTLKREWRYKDAEAPRIPPVRAAFYGRTNAAGADAALAVVRQFRQCQDAAGNAMITGVFYDAAGGVSRALTQMVGQFEPLAVRAGGWTDLAAATTSTNQLFTMIVCESPDRIARRPAELHARLRLPAQHGVTLLFAGLYPYEPLPADGLAYLTQITASGLAAMRRGTGRDQRRRADER